jgi:uncharacterized membrane protein (DUF441 family)
LRRALLAIILAASVTVLRPAPVVHGQITDYQCQQQFRQWAGPYMQRMLWFANQQFAMPTTPVGTPILSPGPIGAYPGFQGIAAGPGGPTWGIANGLGFNNLAQYGQVNALTGGALSVPAVTQAFINASPGGISGLGTANLATLAPLQQGLVGNVTGAAALREAAVGNRITAGLLWTNLNSYPLSQAANLEDMVSAIQLWVANTCPAASPSSDASTSPSPPPSSPPTFRAAD